MSQYTELPLAGKAAERLARICGMFGSAHEGERAAAALKADLLVRSHGLTWQRLFVPYEPEGFREQIRFCLANLDLLTRWEHGFLLGIPKRQHLSRKQTALLQEIVARLWDAGGRP